MPEEESSELKFRLIDGTDIGPNTYAASTTIATLKESILAQWPKDKENAPQTINDIKLINAGKFLDDNKTVAESVAPIREMLGGVITMHVLVRLSILEKGSEMKQMDTMKKNRCSCTIL